MAGFFYPLWADIVIGGKLPTFNRIEADSVKNSPADSAKSKKDTIKLKYPIRDQKNFEDKQKNSLDFKDPSVIKKEIVYDTASGTYIEREVVNGEDIRLPEEKTLEELLKEDGQKQQQDYFRQRSQASSFTRGNTSVIPKLYVGPKIFDKIFGGGVIDIRPQGSAEITLGGNFNVVRNPSLTARQQRNGQFDFKQKIQLNLTGNIGERLKVNMNYDTEATFDFENQIKLNWAGKEDDIIKNIELGNVTLPLNSTLIPGAQSLFGAKVGLQFGKLMVTSIFTQQRGQSTETTVQGGAQVTNFNIQADNYDVNRHFFLSHFFADNYENWLSRSPIITSPVVITRVEVWVTNRSGDFTASRDVLAFMDLGENDPYNNRWAVPGRPFQASNNANILYEIYNTNPQARASADAVNFLRQEGLDPIADFQLLNYARKLGDNEFTYNPQLGYVSLNQALNNDEILAVAYEYTYNGQVFKVGEFGLEVPENQNQPNVLMLKMLKGATVTTNLPIWDLMMKNIYSLGSFNISRDKFVMNVFYADDPSGADLNYIPAQEEPQIKGIPLIQLLNLDNVNVQQEPQPDGLFDFVEGTTVNSTNGRIIFPVREPFGSSLSRLFLDSNTAKYYAYQELYDSTKWLAQQEAIKNKFFLRGSYQGTSSNEISIGTINVPQGSVRVTANGTLLTENVDYTVDYTLGRVRILNQGLINSGAIIKVSAENNALFNVQQKTLVGTRLDYKFNKDLILGGTIMHIWERPLTPKVNIGEEPLLNTMIGIDGSYKTESIWLTKMLDKLPFLSTKEPSSIQFSGEYARLFPHNPRTIGQRGTSFIDDFEASETPFDLRLGNNWFLASTPEGQPSLFPETADPGNSLQFGYNRGRLAWYIVDPIFFRVQNASNPNTPPNLNNPTERSNHYTREVLIEEVFPNRQLPQGAQRNIATLDLAFFPYEKGPFNYRVNNLTPEGDLNNPEESWAGITRKIETTDFEAANIDYIEFWIMDPFDDHPIHGRVMDGKGNTNNTTGGDLYVNLGSISEDVIRDSRKSFENGLPRSTNDPQLVDTTSQWQAKVPNIPTLNNAFDADPNARNNQDVGLDGWNDQEERLIYQRYIDTIGLIYGVNSQIYNRYVGDPSGDNYLFHSSSQSNSQSLNVLQRYKYINNTQGNSPPATFQPDGYPIGRTNLPDDEDINRDFSLNIQEEYFQYKIDLRPGRLVVGQNFVTDSVVHVKTLEDGSVDPVTYYQIRIPRTAFSQKVGNISDFKSIRFIRVFLKGFTQPVVVRFASMQLVRADWRRYTKSLAEPDVGFPVNPVDRTQFSVGTVNIEENGTKQPVPYRLPPGFFRTLDPTNPTNIQQNEQSLALNVCNLEDGDARAVFKTSNFDIRNYKTLRMFIHAEGQSKGLRDGDVTAFIRVGTDLENNYYEYEIPLVITGDRSVDERLIWPEANELRVPLEEFYQAKLDRESANVPLTVLFQKVLASGRKISVIGLPDMSNIRIMMIGIRNPKKRDNPNDDGQAKCGEFWFNEFRVTDFNNEGGWAATARLVTKLADLGTVSMSGNITTIGFGGIDKKLNQRSLQDIYQYDISGTFELGKFFPVRSGLSIPFFIGHSQTFILPKFNPLNPDILLEKALDNAETREERDQIRFNAVDLTTRRSYNFTNVRKNPTSGAKQRFYSISNFNISYSFNEVTRRNQTYTEFLEKTWKGSLGYNFSPETKFWEPFRKIGKSKWLTLIRDFNIGLRPQSIGARGDLDRFYGRTINRANDNPFTIVPILYNKNFTFNRFYDLRWDITRNLKFDLNANAMARIDENPGLVNQNERPGQSDTILSNLLGFGRMTSYTQAANLNYTLPLNKIPITDWINASVRYSANYGWNTAPPIFQSIGNSIENSRTINYNGQLNFTTLYNKVPFLKKALSNAPPPRPTGRPKPPAKDGKTAEEEEEEEKKKKKEEPKKYVLVKFLAMVKNASFSYSQTEGIKLPGFNPYPFILGNNFNQDAPGLPFIFGSQDPNIRFDLASRGLLSGDTNQNRFYTKAYQTAFNGKATLEPFRDFRIELTATRTYRLDERSVFKVSPTSGIYEDQGFQEVGSFQMTSNFWRTALTGTYLSGGSPIMREFEANRAQVSRQLATEEGRFTGIDTSSDPNRNGYAIGYNRNNQDVLIHSFLSAYSGKAPSGKLNLFDAIPSVNWRITWNGLSKLKSIKKFASNVAITHNYTSTVNYNEFRSPLVDSISLGVNPLDGNYFPKYTISSVTINEQFNPLLGIDITFVNNISTKIEYRSTRTITLGVTNFQVTEQFRRGFTIGFGYRAKGFKLPIKINGRRPSLDNDLNVRFDLAYDDVVTVIRRLDAQVDRPTQGSKSLTINPQIDYQINEKLNLRIFYTRRTNTPATTNAFPTILTQGGVALRYTIQ